MNYIALYLLVREEITRLRSRPDDQCSKCDDRKHLQNELAKSRILMQDFLGNNFKCNICQEILLDGVETSCKHCYCGGCLKRWRWEMNNCPLCRIEFVEEEEPTLLTSVNRNIDDIFNSFPSTMKQEREEKVCILEMIFKLIIYIYISEHHIVFLTRLHDFLKLYRGRHFYE